MRVTLVNPNFQRRIRRIAQTTVGPPLGLAYLAATARVAGHEVRIVDANALALTLARTAEEACRGSPDVVGVTATTATVRLAGAVCEAVKARAPGILTVVGGPHTTFLPERTLREEPSVDVVARGEAEHSFLAFLQALAQGGIAAARGVAGFAFRNPDGSVHDTGMPPPVADLDALPWPARDLLPMDRYRCTDSDSFTTLLAMRGCPCACIYCAVPAFFGRAMRCRDPARVVAEMEEVHRHDGVEFFSFVDDTFTSRPQWVLDFCDRVVATGLHRRARWICLTRPDMVTEDLLVRMRRAGCVRVELGIESASDRGRRFLRKGLTEDGILQAFRAARRAGMSTMAFVILNIPGETEDDIRRTRDLVLRVAPDYLQVSFLTPYPGTPLRDLAEPEGWVATDDWSQYSFLNDTVLAHGTMPPREVRRWHRRIVRGFYLRPRMLFNLARLILTGTARFRPLVRTVFAGLADLFLGRFTREAGP